MATPFYQGTAFDEFFQVPVGRVIIDGAGGPTSFTRSTTSIRSCSEVTSET